MLLTQQRAKALAISMRSLIIATMGALWLLAYKHELEIKIAFVDFSIPASYIIFSVATVLMLAIVHAVSYMLLNDFVRIVSNKLFNFDAPWALTAIINGESVWGNAALPQWRYFESGTTHTWMGRISLALVSIPILALAFLSFVTVIVVGERVISAGPSTLDVILVILSWLLLAFSVTLIFILLGPFTFQKNKNFIRWSFLFRMHRRFGMLPKLGNVWLGDAKPRR